MKPSENETFAEAVDAIGELVTTLHAKECGEGFDIKDVWSLVQQIKNRIEAAHKREVEKLNFELLTKRSEQKTAANVIIEYTNKVEELRREVAELRECLKPILAVHICSGGTQVVSDALCAVAECKSKWRNALEGAKDEAK